MNNQLADFSGTKKKKWAGKAQMAMAKLEMRLT
jgi:hypothetical protein